MIDNMEIAKRLVEQRDAGQMSDFTFGLFQKELAMKMFGDESASEGEALSKFFGTAIGRVTLQEKSRLSVAEELELRKHEGLGGTISGESGTAPDAPTHNDPHQRRNMTMAASAWDSEARKLSASRKISLSAAYDQMCKEHPDLWAKVRQLDVDKATTAQCFRHMGEGDPQDPGPERGR
jgi:hypothetical protein